MKMLFLGVKFSEHFIYVYLEYFYISVPAQRGAPAVHIPIRRSSGPDELGPRGQPSDGARVGGRRSHSSQEPHLGGSVFLTQIKQEFDDELLCSGSVIVAQRNISPRKSRRVPLQSGQVYFINDGVSVNVFEWLTPLVSPTGALVSDLWSFPSYGTNPVRCLEPKLCLKLKVGRKTAKMQVCE